MTEAMPASAPEEIENAGVDQWNILTQEEFLEDKVAKSEARKIMDYWQTEEGKKALAETERKTEELMALKNKAGREIAVDVIRNPEKYETIQREAEEKIKEIRERKKEEWIRQGTSEEEAARLAREYDGRMSIFVTAKEAREWESGKVGNQSVDAMYRAEDVKVEGGEVEVGWQAKHLKKERVSGEDVDKMGDEEPVEIRIWVDEEFGAAELSRRRAVRKMQIAKRYEAVSEKLWPGDLDVHKKEAEIKAGLSEEQKQEQFFPSVPENETAEGAMARLEKRLSKEERMLAKDRETLEITMSGAMTAENKRRKEWNEERVKSDERIVEDIKFQMDKLRETGDPVAAEKALMERWRDQEKAQIEELRAQAKKMRFWQGAKKREARVKIAELEKRQREYWPMRVEGRFGISHNV